ncbi:MAG: hypothetical protein QM775_23300 [Pirellulales bacterium]
MLDLGKATLQIGADQTNETAGTLTVRMNGGSIEGFLRIDDQLPAVYRTVGAGISFQLDGDSYLGQNVLQGVNGVDSGKAATINSPFTNSLTGARLELKGADYRARRAHEDQLRHRHPLRPKHVYRRAQYHGRHGADRRR